MKIVVFSDTHGKTDLMHAIIERNRQSTDLFIHLGDVERDFEYMKSIVPVGRAFGVRGNNDFCSSLPEKSLLDLDGKKVLVTHGHRFNVSSSYALIQGSAREMGADIVLFGHTHTSFECYRDGLLLLNPGSLSLPRDGKPSFATLEIRKGQVLWNIAEASPEQHLL